MFFYTNGKMKKEKNDTIQKVKMKKEKKEEYTEKYHIFEN